MSETHYDAAYFGWQTSVGAVGAVLNQRKFLPWIRGNQTVLDFGCGNGALLAALPGAEKIGVEVGREARVAAASKGLSVVERTAEVPDASVDVVISNHALEHVERPLDELRELRRVLRPGGVAVFVVPINDWRSDRAFDPSDPNHHLYTWTPQLFGNLLTDAGFEVASSKVMTHARRRRFLALHNQMPAWVYDLAAWALALVTRSRQIHAVAYKPQRSG